MAGEYSSLPRGSWPSPDAFPLNSRLDEVAFAIALLVHDICEAQSVTSPLVVMQAVIRDSFPASFEGIGKSTPPLFMRTHRGLFATSMRAMALSSPDEPGNETN
jgi:hypothetical protein